MILFLENFIDSRPAENFVPRKFWNTKDNRRLFFYIKISFFPKNLEKFFINTELQ